MKVSAIIVAAGSGRRMGFDKLLADLGGKPVLRHSIDAFLAVPGLIELIVVSDIGRFTTSTQGLNDPRLKRIDGGAERHDSVAAGLRHISDEVSHIAVHDGARPLIQLAQIQRCLDAAFEHSAASCAHRITETLKRSDGHDRTASSVDRTNLWAMETPQVFKLSLLREAYRHILDSSTLVTDEVSALEQIGIATHLVSNPTPNPKITFPHDLPLAEHLLDFQAG